MAVYKRGDLWHYDLTVDGNRYRGPTRQRSKAKAREYEQAVLERVMGIGARKVPTLGEAFDKWFTAKVAGGRSEADTAYRIEIVMRLLERSARIDRIDTPDIAEAMQRRRLEPRRKTRLALSNSTVNRDLIDMTMRPMLNYARKVLKAPVQDIDWASLRLAEPRGRTRAFTPDELSDWTGHLPEWHRPVHAFIARYGVRLREAFFPLEAVNVPAGRVTLRKRKNGAEHILPLLPDDARDIATRIGRARAAGIDTVWFRDLPNGQLEPIHWRGFQSASARAKDAAGLSDARAVHDLRHHAATSLLRATGNVMTVKHMLGHDSLASTARYAHTNDADILEGLTRMTDTLAREEEKVLNNRNELAKNGTGF